MTPPSALAGSGPRSAPALSLESVERAVLWLLIFSGAFVFIEPAPYEFLFLLALLTFMVRGLPVGRILAPLVVLLVLYNVGGIFSLVPLAHDRTAVTFVAVSLYLAATAVFLAAAMSNDTAGRIAIVRNAYVAGAVVTAVAGILGYFDVAGLGEVLTENRRARGFFKDPNVFGTFLIPPLLLLLREIVLGTRGIVRASLASLILAAGVFLSFSRGAWFNAAGSAAVMLVLAFLTATSPRVRGRVVVTALLGTAVLAGALLLALSLPQVWKLFVVRASLVQAYDVGETGRFGDQLNSLPLLLASPNGLGPFGYRTVFGNDPHNVYLNAFAAYGWLGGISYLGFVAATMVVGWRLAFAPTPWQNFILAVWPALFMTLLQGVQIDSDHWRHLYLLVGLIWGLFAAASCRAATPR